MDLQCPLISGRVVGIGSGNPINKAISIKGINIKKRCFREFVIASAEQIISMSDAYNAYDLIFFILREHITTRTFSKKL